MLVREVINAEVTVTGSQERHLQREKNQFRLAESSFGVMEELRFNVDHGYLEGLVRGMKAGILTRTDYHNLAECNTLEGRNIVHQWHFWNVFYPQLHPCFKCLCVYIWRYFNNNCSGVLTDEG